MSEQLHNNLIEANKKAKHIIELLKQSKKISHQQCYDGIKQYIRYKFMLNEDDLYTDDILELAKISLGRQLNVDFEKVKKIDIADYFRRWNNTNINN